MGREKRPEGILMRANAWSRCKRDNEGGWWVNDLNDFGVEIFYGLQSLHTQQVFRLTFLT